MKLRTEARFLSDRSREDSVFFNCFVYSLKLSGQINPGFAPSLKKETNYRLERNFCGSLFLQIGDFLWFAGTDFYNKDRLVFLGGNQFFAIFRKHPAVPSIDNIFVFIEYVPDRNTYFLNNKPVVYRFVSEWKRKVVIEQTRFLSTVFLCNEL